MIPNTYTKREGAPKERELLCGRIIDRPIRPLFPPGFYHEVQVLRHFYFFCLFCFVDL
jgi:polyribonucleotide nucleotidyltransferase